MGHLRGGFVLEYLTLFTVLGFWYLRLPVLCLEELEVVGREAFTRFKARPHLWKRLKYGHQVVDPGVVKWRQLDFLGQELGNRTMRDAQTLASRFCACCFPAAQFTIGSCRHMQLSSLIRYRNNHNTTTPQNKQPNNQTTKSDTMTHNNNNTIWRGSVLTGEEPPPHSEELNHALPQADGPTQS